MSQAPNSPKINSGTRDDGEHAADALGLNALLAQQLRAYAGQRVLHFSAAHPNLEASRALQVGPQDERPRVGRPRLGIAAGIQDVVVRAPDLDALDVALIEQASRQSRRRAALLPSLSAGAREVLVMLLSESGAGLQIGFQLSVRRWHR